jgi:hypothetical protein
MRKPFSVATLALALTTQSVAAPATASKPVAESEAVQIKGDFAGSLVLTSDIDWKKKWDTPANAMPSFNKASVLSYGKKVFILTLFANPRLDGAGSADLRCDFKITNPVGKVQLSRTDLSCHAGRLVTNKHNVYLSEPVIAFSGDPGDPPGIWVVEVKLRGANRANRAVELLLRSSFELKAGK